MTTTSFILAAAVAAAIHGGGFWLSYRTTLQKCLAAQASLQRAADERKRLQGLPVVGSLLFGVLFVFLIFFLSDASSPLTPLSGIIYGLAAGALIYLPQSLSWLALVLLPLRAALSYAAAGIVASGLAGLVTGVLLQL